jgi:hypothetical protein
MRVRDFKDRQYEEDKEYFYEYERDKEYFYSLLPEKGPELCKKNNCNHKRVSLSVMCAKHHFEMVKNKPCPWNVSEDGSTIIEATNKYAGELIRKAKTDVYVDPNGVTTTSLDAGKFNTLNGVYSGPTSSRVSRGTFVPSVLDGLVDL